MPVPMHIRSSCPCPCALCRVPCTHRHWHCCGRAICAFVKWTVNTIPHMMRVAGEGASVCIVVRVLAGSVSGVVVGIVIRRGGTNFNLCDTSDNSLPPPPPRASPLAPWLRVSCKWKLAAPLAARATGWLHASCSSGVHRPWSNFYLQPALLDPRCSCCCCCCNGSQRASVCIKITFFYWIQCFNSDAAVRRGCLPRLEYICIISWVFKF